MISVNKSTVMKSLKLALRMVDHKSQSVIQRSIALEAREGFLCIQATDLHSVFEARIACEGVLPLTVVNARAFCKAFDASATRQRGRYSPDKKVLLGVRGRRKGSPGSLDISSDHCFSVVCVPKSVWPRSLPIQGPDQVSFNAPLLADAIQYVNQTEPCHVWFAKDGSIFADNGHVDGHPLLSVGDDSPAKVSTSALGVLLDSIEHYGPTDVLAAMVPDSGCRFTFLVDHGSVSVSSRAA
jgi:hypothetical protein